MNNIKSIYTKVRGIMQINREMSEEFEIKYGVKQENSPNPLLLITYMDRTIKNCKSKTPKMTLGYKKLRLIQIEVLVYTDNINR